MTTPGFFYFIKLKPDAMTINRIVIITGKVQGVFYRGSVREECERLGVNG